MLKVSPERKKQRAGVRLCSDIQFQQLEGRSEVKNSETVRLAMLPFAPLYHIICGSWCDHGDHMIYEQTAWYEPASILKAKFCIIEDLHQNYWKFKEFTKESRKKRGFIKLLLQILDDGKIWKRDWKDGTYDPGCSNPNIGLLLYLLITVGNFLRWDSSSAQRCVAKRWERFVRFYIRHFVDSCGSGWSRSDWGRCCHWLRRGGIPDEVIPPFAHRGDFGHSFNVFDVCLALGFYFWSFGGCRFCRSWFWCFGGFRCLGGFDHSCLNFCCSFVVAISLSPTIAVTFCFNISGRFAVSIGFLLCCDFSIAASLRGNRSFLLSYNLTIAISIYFDLRCWFGSSCSFCITICFLHSASFAIAILRWGSCGLRFGWFDFRQEDVCCSGLCFGGLGSFGGHRWLDDEFIWSRLDGLSWSGLGFYKCGFSRCCFFSDCLLLIAVIIVWLRCYFVCKREYGQRQWKRVEDDKDTRRWGGGWKAQTRDDRRREKDKNACFEKQWHKDG